MWKMSRIDCKFLFLIIALISVTRFMFYFVLVENTKLKTSELFNNNYSLQCQIDRPVFNRNIDHGEQSNKNHPNQQDSLKINEKLRILIWTNYFHIKKSWLGGRGNKYCPKNNCVITEDRNCLFSSDAVVFHWFNIDHEDLPPALDHQKWVLYNMESPHHTHIDVDNLGLKKFDWIISYRTDSDIHTPYGKVVECNRNWTQRHSFERKTKSIAWFVSHCSTPSDRETYAEILGQYIDVDIYGKCGSHSCRSRDDFCNEIIARRYKFYLSFENSICKDYVTEKAFLYMNYDIIPIVLGGANYSSIFPENSYIDVMNFSSPKHLSEYLEIVSNDETLYNSYFKWKHNYCIEREFSNHIFCKLCDHLRNNSNERKIANKEGLKEWWITGSNCSRMVFNNESISLVNFQSDNTTEVPQELRLEIEN